jgi:hypothetical protein
MNQIEINNIVIKESGEKVNNSACTNCDEAVWYIAAELNRSRKLTAFCKIFNQKVYINEFNNTINVNLCSEVLKQAENEKQAKLTEEQLEETD